jgi:hypothetical protein
VGMLNNEEKIFNLLEKMYVEFNKRFKSIDKRFENVEAELSTVKATVVNIENDHGQKLDALFDGYKLNSEKLDRIEAEVAKHEEVILRRIR